MTASKASCSVCGRLIGTYSNGTMRRHSRGISDACTGSDLTPDQAHPGITRSEALVIRYPFLRSRSRTTT